MKDRGLLFWIPAALALVYALLIAGWHLYDPTRRLERQEPGADHRPEGLERHADDVRIGEFYMQYAEAPASPLQGVWGGFRGPARDNIVRTAEPVRTEGDFTPVWEVETGEGHAAPVIYKGRVYVLDYDESLLSDALRCFSLETGQELWRRWYRVRMKRNHGFSRTIPAVGDGYLVSIGPEGHVMCCRPETGELLWTLDMQQTFGSEIPFWYTGQCPLVEDDTLVLAPAGPEVLLAGVDVRTGQVRWTTPNSPGFKMSHSSVMPMELGGKRTYVYVGVGGVCGVSAEAADRGVLLWSTSAWQPSVVAPSPLRLSSSRVFLVAGYGTGGALLEVTRSGSAWRAEILEQYKSDKGLSSEQQTPIFYDGMIISIMPKDAGGPREKIVLYPPSDLHASLWRSGADEKFGLGPYLVLNDLLLALGERGELFTYRIGRGSLSLLKREVVMDGVDAWGPMAYADGRLLVRDAHRIKCLQITR